MDKETHDTLKYSSLVFKANKETETATQILTSLGRKDISEDENKNPGGKAKTSDEVFWERKTGS